MREPVSLWNVVAGSSQIVTGGRATVPTYRDDNHFDGELDPGGPNNYSNAKAWADATTARTAIGLSQDRRTLTLFTVDVRGGSEGMRCHEVAAVLIRDFGVADALNLDGGGSTTMAMEDANGVASIVNVRQTTRPAASSRPAWRCLLSGAIDKPSTAARRDRAGCPSRDSRRSNAGPSCASGLPAAPRSPVMSSTRGSAGSPLTLISRYVACSLVLHSAVSRPGTLTNGVSIGLVGRPRFRRAAAHRDHPAARRQIGAQRCAARAERCRIRAIPGRRRIGAVPEQRVRRAASPSSGTRSN